jgi:hypothetical protein
MRYKNHAFRPGDTIDGILRLLGRHDLTHVELSILRAQFNELNGSAVPRPGELFRIPMPDIVADETGLCDDDDGFGF